MANLRVRLVDEEWQEFDAIVERLKDSIDGVWYDNIFLPLVEFYRFGTPWIGEKPEFLDEKTGHVVNEIVGVHQSLPIYLEVDGCSYRIWEVAA